MVAYTISVFLFIIFLLIFGSIIINFNPTIITVLILIALALFVIIIIFVLMQYITNKK